MYKTNSIHIHYKKKKIKCPGTNLPKYLTDIYNESYKPLMKTTEENKNIEDFHTHGVEELILKCPYWGSELII